jgi:signal transduction histidine kinase
MFGKQKKLLQEGNLIIPVLSVLRFLLIIFVIGFSVFFYQNQAAAELSKFKALEEERVLVLKDDMEYISDLVVGDLLIAKNHYEFGHYLRGVAIPGEDHKQNLVDELLVMASLRKVYDQIRFIDLEGNELIRVNHRAGLTYVTPDKKLQNKVNRYYFKEAINLNEGDIFVSPLDLNVEGGEIEAPLKPMIRIATPMFYEGEKKGVLIFNYLAQELLDSLEYRLSTEGEKVFLVNEDGYWLKGPELKDEWGFMYGDDSKTIFNWDTLFNIEVLRENKHQGEHESGLFTFNTVEPFDYSGGTRKNLTIFADSSLRMSENYHHEWKVISFLPRNILYHDTNQLFIYLVITNIIIIILLLGASSILLVSLRERLASEKIILKLNDTLRIITKVLRHDLANAFTHVNFSLELFKENKKDKTSLEEIGKSANKGIEIIGQMKELERMISKGEKLKRVNLKTVLDEVIKEYKIEFNITGEGSIQADEGISSVFDNIISNAIRHGGTKKMDIQITKEKSQIVIKFIDYGKGISEDVKSSIFKEGFKYGETGNTGLGLYIVEQTVKRYKGSILVEDNKPSGAIFIIKMPN